MKNLLKKFFSDTLNRILLYLIIFLGLMQSCSLFGSSNDILVYQNKKIVGSFTKEEFTSLIQSADLYVQEIDAEQSKRVEIEVKDTPYKVEKENKYKARFSIKWKNADNKVIKEVVIDSYIVINENSANPYPSWRVAYRNVAEYSLPVLIILCVVLGIL